MPNAKRDVSKIIEQLKIVRIEKGITYQMIVDATEKNGEAVSMASVKRVFSDNNVTEFRWSTTIRPIAKVVLGIDDDQEFDPKQSSKSYYDEAVALRDIIALKNDMIEDARDKIAMLKDSVERERRSNKALQIALVIACALLIACAFVLFSILT